MFAFMPKAHLAHGIDSPREVSNIDILKPYDVAAKHLAKAAKDLLVVLGTLKCAFSNTATAALNAAKAKLVVYINTLCIVIQ